MTLHTRWTFDVRRWTELLIMKFVDEFRDPETAKTLVGRIRKSASRIERKVRIMEICGSHTVAIFRAGIKALLPGNINLISGPGCPVCVTGIDDMDRMISLAGDPPEEGIVIATFGDMLRVPGSKSSLEREKGGGADVRIATTPMDALLWARENPQKQVVFLGVGFETTSPTIAAAIVRAKKEGISNLSVYPAFKLLPPALTVLLEDPEIALDGFLCPGHVSVMIGADAYQPFASHYGKPCAITGFEPIDILYGISVICDQIAEKRHEVINAYGRAVSNRGNEKAMGLLEGVFEPSAVHWRGLGEIEGSGLIFREGFSHFDAKERFGLGLVPTGAEPSGCACGSVLRGFLDPPGCPLFGRECTPDSPIGSCMVSTEGSCAAWYKYST